MKTADPLFTPIERRAFKALIVLWALALLANALGAAPITGADVLDARISIDVKDGDPAYKTLQPDGPLNDALAAAYNRQHPQQPAPVEVDPAPTPTPPAPQPTPTPPGVLKSGQSILAAAKAAKPGSTIYLERGGKWTVGLADIYVHLSNVRFAAAGDASQPQPIICPANEPAVLALGWTNVTFTDITFAGGGSQPTSPGLRFNGCTNVTLEHCTVSNFTYGITAESWNGRRNKGITLRGCTVRDTYPPTDNGSGAFVDMTDGLLIEDCLFDTCGWRVGKRGATVFNHLVYVTGSCGPIVARRNVFANASSHGLQARSGGSVVDNLFVNNPIHLSFGLVNGGGAVVTGGVSGEVRGNVFVGSRDLNGETRGQAIETGNVKQATIADNLIDHSGPNEAVRVDVCGLSSDNKAKPSGILNLTIAGNAVSNSSGGPYWQHRQLSTKGKGLFQIGTLNVQSSWGTSPDLRPIATETWARSRVDPRGAAAAGIAKARAAAGVR